MDAAILADRHFRPHELALLSRVYSQAITAKDTKRERIDRALATIALYRSGITDEAALLRMVWERLFTVDVHKMDFIAGV